MHDVYKNIDNYNSDKENKILIVFDDIIADMINSKKLNSIVAELFIKCRKLNISLVFISQRMLEIIARTFLLRKFQIKENFRKLQ